MKNKIMIQIASAAVAATLAAQTFAVSDDPGTVLQPSVSVPEPGMLSLVGVGIAIMLAVKFKNRNK